MEQEEVYQTPPKAQQTYKKKASMSSHSATLGEEQEAQHTFRRKTQRDSILSPGSIRVSKLSKSKDEAIFERMHIMIRGEISILKEEIGMNMQETLDEHKKEMYKAMKREFDKEMEGMRAELHKEIKGELVQWVQAETAVLKAIVDTLSDTHKAMLNWKTDAERQLKEKTQTIKELEEKVNNLKEEMKAGRLTQGSSGDRQLQDEVQELKTNLENGLKSWTSVVQQHEDNTKWIEGAKKEKYIDPKIQEEMNVLKSNLENEMKTWSSVVKQHEDNTKWIEGAKQERNAEPTPPATIINLTLEEEEKRRKRALHVRVTGLKDTDNIGEEVAELLTKMGASPATHTGAWRVGKKGMDKDGKPRDRALILRFPSVETRREFLKKRSALKQTGIFLGDDLTLAQVAHMQEKMPEIRAAREKGKIAFYRGGKVVILEGQSK